MKIKDCNEHDINPIVCTKCDDGKFNLEGNCVTGTVANCELYV